MQPDNKVQPTHVNAYRADLADKEAQYNALGGEIESLKETIATMEQADAAPQEPTPTAEAKPADNKSGEVKSLENLKRDELEDEAEDAGVSNPDDKEQFPNKEVLAKATAEAKASGSDNNSSKPSEPVSPDPSTKGVEAPSKPIVETPPSSDVPPASSEVPQRVSE